MSKSLSRNLYLLGILGFIVAFVVLTVSAAGATANADGTITGGNAALALVSTLLFAVAGIITFIAWIGALIKTAQLQRWGWFVCLIVFSGITMLIYVFAGPETAKEQVPARVG
ncbi:MAG TPA: hypothetical protein VGP82_15205 [Ktedonobacterales bacterium]|nr:hypothetical protein [Ktedonobacterales bacterium]